MKRLVRDVNDIMKNPLHDNGIYYIHDETDMLSGTALIIGPENTPYFGGYYFFSFKFTTQYPYMPPIVTYCTNGEKIRFNSVDYTDNTLSGLQRGIDGTGVQTYHPLYSTVYSYIPNNLLDESYYDLTWNSYNYNSIEGDPLQISTTNAALFLNNPRT